MSKIVVVPKDDNNLDVLLGMDVDVILIGVSGLAVNCSYYVSYEELDRVVSYIKGHGKKVFVSLNKIISNSDLVLLEDVLIKVDSLGVDGVIFYDYSVISIKKRLGLSVKLIIAREHSNASIYSHLFYKECGIDSSFVTSDITIEEILDIKKKVGINLLVLVYGCIPIMYSRRYLLTNYFKYINQDMKDDYYYIKDVSGEYIIKEEEYGSAVYTKSVLDLDYEFSMYRDYFDYVVLYSSFVSEDDYIKAVSHYIDINNNKDVKFNDGYKGFSYTKTIYKVKNDG